MRVSLSLLSGIALGVIAALQASAQLGVQTAPPSEKTKGKVVRFLATGEEEECDVPAGWFPTRNDPEKTLCLWNQKTQEHVKYARFAASSKTVTAATDVLADAFGGLRLALSTAVAASTENDEDAAGAGDEPTIQQDRTQNLLTANGGNIAVALSYPIYYTPIGDGSFVWNTYARAAANISALGGDTETTLEFSDLNGNLEFAVSEFRADLLSYKQEFNVLGYAKLSGVKGTSKFNDAIGHGKDGVFWQSQVGLGLRVAKVLAIYATWNKYYRTDIPTSGGAVTFVVGK